MFSTQDTISPSIKELIDLLKSLTTKSDSENIIKKLDDMIISANNSLDSVYSTINNEEVISKIDKAFEEYEDKTIWESNVVKMKYNDKFIGFYIHELPVLSELSDCLEKSALFFLEVKREFKKYKKKLDDIFDKIEEFKQYAQKVREIISEEVNKDEIDINIIKSNLNELNYKFIGFSINCEISTETLLDIETIIDDKLPIDIENINVCVDKVLQDEQYNSIVNGSNVFISPPSRDPNSLVKGELKDQVESLLVDNTQENAGVSVDSSNM